MPGARTVTFMAGSDNPSDNVSLSDNVHAQPTFTNDGTGADNVSTADPSAFHKNLGRINFCMCTPHDFLTNQLTELRNYTLKSWLGFEGKPFVQALGPSPLHWPTAV